MSLAGQVAALSTKIANTLRDSYKPRLLPAGGLEGQSLVKTGAGDFAAKWGEGSPYTLDGLSPSALFSAPRVMRLQGADVPISSLRTFSSAQKYTVGSDGNLILNPANGSAYDWFTGRRRLLVEAIPSTNFALYSNDFSNNTAWAITNGSLSSGVADPTGGTSATTVTIASGQTRVVVQQVYSGPANGAQTTHSFWLRRRQGSGPIFMYSPAGAYVEVTSKVSSNWSRVPVTAPATGGTMVINFYSDGAAGDQIDIWGAQAEISPCATSYTPCGSSPTTRPADVVTEASGVLPLLQVAGSGKIGASLVLRGSRLSGQGIISAQSQGAGIALNAAGSAALLTDDAGHVLTVPSGAPGNDFGLAVAYGPNGRVACLNGGPVVSDSYPLFAPSDTAIQLGRSMAYGDGNLLFDEGALFSFPGSNAGIQGQGRLYA